MQRNILKHFTIIGGGTLINMFLGVITTPLITRLVDPVEYGQLSIFTMYAGIAVMVLCLGLDQALVRYYYEHKEDGEKRSLLFRCIKLPVAISVTVSVVVILLSISGVVTFEFPGLIMAILCLYTIIEIIYRFSVLLVRLAYKSKIYSLLSILKKISYILLAAPMLFFIDGKDVLILVTATTVAALLCMLMSVVVQAQLWKPGAVQKDLCHVTQRQLLTYSYPYIISMGITTLFQACDKIALNMYRSYAEVGVYSSTMTLVHIFSIIQTTFNALWQPMAVERYSEDPNDRKFYQLGNQAITVIMFFIGISLILVKDVFAILLGEKYREAAYILPFLIFNPIMYTISETTVSGLVFMKKSKMQVVVALGACVTNIIGNALLVPKLGCQGAAISTGLSYIVFFALRTVLSNRYFYVDYKLKHFFLLTGIVVAYAFYNTFIAFNIVSVVGYIMCLAALALLYKNTIIWGVGYLKNYAVKMMRKGST